MSTDPHDRVTARIQHVTLIMYREKFTATETQNKSAQATSDAGRLGSHHVEVCNNKELIANYYCCISRYSAKPTHKGNADKTIYQRRRRLAKAQIVLMGQRNDSWDTVA